MLMDIPSNSKLVSSVEELNKYFEDGLEMIHVAVKRILPYYHHYVILAEQSVWNCYLKIVQYNGGSSYSVTGSTAGEVEKVKIPISQVETDICDGLYVITGTDYPKEATDFVDACSRYRVRLHERSYSVVYNNCEHLANYIMTGCVKSEQIDKAEPLMKAIADIVDMVVNNGKSNIVNTAIDAGGNALAAIWIVLKAGNQIFSAVAREAISNTGRIAGTSITAENLIVYTAEQFSTIYSAEQILCSQTCCEIAETVGLRALVETCLVSGALTLVVETGFATWKIYNLNIMRKAGKIQILEWLRETAKLMVSVPVATTLTVAGSVIGQAICPMPVFGVFLGGFVGNVVGRFVSGVVTGRIFDHAVFKLKEFYRDALFFLNSSGITPLCMRVFHFLKKVRQYIQKCKRVNGKHI